MRRSLSSKAFWLLPFLLLILLTVSGCVGLAEDIATHLASHDLKKVEQDFQIFEADLRLFRKCLKQRGGRCEGTDATPLPGSSQHLAAATVVPSDPGGSQLLTDSMADLPADDPTRRAHEVLSHPVVRQAAALHNHLRGHASGSVAGVSVETRQGPDGQPESTVTLDMRVGQTEHFHTSLLSSVATTGWESLVGHCDNLLAKHSGAADLHKLEADCRRATFIRGYLGAYFRHGEFIEVDVELAGAINLIKTTGKTLEGDVQRLLDDVSAVKSKVDGEETVVLSALGAKTGEVGDEVRTLIEAVSESIEQRFGSAGKEILRALDGLAVEAGDTARKLADRAESELVGDVQNLVAELDADLDKLESRLGDLQNLVARVSSTLVSDVTRGLDSVDKSLSNVFRISRVGFVSRDTTFRARLPTLQVTLDPSAAHLVKVIDEDLTAQDPEGEELTSSTDFSKLGVATDTSGVGVGSSIGAELVRVFLEALFDAEEGLPAIAPADSPSLRPTGLDLGPFSLPLFQSPTGHLDVRDLTRATEINDRVATQARVIVGRIISGIGPFNLNNKPLEDLIVEVVATSVRKAAEKATWCWFACNLDVDLTTLETDAKKTAKDAAKAAEEKVEAAVKRGEGKAKALVDREAERIKLRLKLSR